MFSKAYHFSYHLLCEENFILFGNVVHSVQIENYCISPPPPIPNFQLNKYLSKVTNKIIIRVFVTV